MIQDSAKADTQWPPKSPRDAWLSSPTRKKKYQSVPMDISPSASPLRRALFTDKSARRDRVGGSSRSPGKGVERNGIERNGVGRNGVERNGIGGVAGSEDGENEDQDEDEDEETLELKLKAIETRLKLKKLRQVKDSPASSVVGDTLPFSKRHVDRDGYGHGLFRSETLVSLSPTKKLDVSARQNGVERAGRQSSPVRMNGDILAAKSVQQSEKMLRYQKSSMPATSSLYSSTATNLSNHSRGSNTPAKSFSERIAEGRQTAKEKLEKESRLSKNRSSGFRSSVRSEKNEGLTPHAISNTNHSRHFSSSRDGSSNSMFRRGSSPIKLRPNGSPKRTENHEDSRRSTNRDTPATPPTHTEDESSAFEPYSGFHLSRRWSDHDTLTRLLENKDLYSIPKLLKVVKSPNFDPPDTENDYVIFGIVAWKSTPYDHKSNQQQQKKSKFMVIKLTDLKWELDLFLFDTGFDQFWKMSLGTVVAILNPGIFPPKNTDTGRFSLKLSSSEDTVIEIGSARDLGFCKSVKKDGQKCSTWIDQRRTEFCDFHVSIQLEKSKAGRMEVNGSLTFAKSGSKHRYKNSQEDGLLREGRQHDSQLHESYYLAPSQFGLVRNASALLDGDDEPGVANTERGRSKRELNRKRVLEKSKERDLAKKLGDVGNGIGSEYLRSRHIKSQDAKDNLKSSQNSSDFPCAMVDAESLGLVKSKVSKTQLCNSKRRRLDAGSEPMGWSTAFKTGLTRVNNSNNEKYPTSPSKKKARFILDRGIREPGRESLGRAVSGNVDSNDDDLEII